MGTRFSVGTRVSLSGWDFLVQDYTVTEETSPLSISDSSGGVGGFSFNIPMPNPDLDRTDTSNPLLTHGISWLIGQPVVITDTSNGVTKGVITSIGTSQDSAEIEVSGLSRLDELNDFGLTAQPYTGTFGGLIGYYFSLAGVTADWKVDPSLASRSVAVPGWSGELWFNLKSLLSAYDAEIALVSGVILVRPLRTRVAPRGKATSMSNSVSVTNLAQSVEVYLYQTQAITNQLVYPPGGWTPETPVLTVNAGETTEVTLELSASISSIQVPTMQTLVSPSHSSSSVYTVVGDDGFPVAPALWASGGGSVSVSIGADTKTLVVRLTGATGIPTINGSYSKSFSLSLASDTTGSQYSTLRIVGTGVAYTREKFSFFTGVSPTETSTVVGVTIDNPFITSQDVVYTTGVRAASLFKGSNLTLTAELTDMHIPGVSETAASADFGTVKSVLVSEIGGTTTFAQVKTWSTAEGINTFSNDTSYWVDRILSSLSAQTFGNVSGSRIWDPLTQRYYRIRSATISPVGVSIGGAEDDTIFEDLSRSFEGLTFAEVKSLRGSVTFAQERMMGYSA